MPASAALAEPRSRKPRYMQLADELRAEIAKGAFPDGFPTESILCHRFGVSRFTVREALRTLSGEGLIQRKRGSGTVIQPAAARGGALHQPLSNVGEILQYARDSRFEAHRMPEGGLPKSIAEQIGLVAGGRWFRFQGLRLPANGGDAVALTEAYLHSDLAPIVDRISPGETTIFRQVEQLADLRVARVTQDIQACAASVDVARALGISRRAPCLRILRCYLDDTGRVFEISASHHPGDRFAYAMHIEVEA
ncbi:MAG: GntR family transcriptional regulator [Sphingomonas sp.]